MQRFLKISNFILVTVIIAIIANASSENLSRRLIPAAVPKTSAAKPTAISSSQPKSLDYYAPILTQGLFGSATRGTLSPIVNAPAGQPQMPMTAPSELLLLGTATGSHRETFALVRNTTKNEERVFRLGDTVFDAGRLVQVTREQAFIVINGKKVELLTPMTPPAAKTAGQPLSPNHTAPVAVASQGGNSFVIDQRALNAALDNPAQAMSDARLLPSQKDGKVEGFRASEVKPQGVFGMIGIKNGDVIKSLNDFPMDSPDKALQSFIALKGQSRLKMDIIRDGQPQTLTYDIR